MRVKIILLLTFLFVQVSFGYEVMTHEEFTTIATERSRIGSGAVLSRLGLPDIPVTQPSEVKVGSINFSINFFPNSKGEDKTIYQLLQNGVDFEDALDIGGFLDDAELGRVRMLNHFYDPQNYGRALYLDGLSLGEPSPSWILEDQEEVFGVAQIIDLSNLSFIKDTPQLFSYKEGREYFYKSLTEPNKIQRDANFGLMFQTLGHVVHHIQDMGQPQHVRNDRHLPWEDDFVEAYVRANYSKDGVERSGIQTLSIEDIVHASPQYSGVSIMLPRTRDYWDWGNNPWDRGLDRIGMAEYASTNFVSDDTNFRWGGSAFETHPEYPQPEIDTVPTEFKDFSTAVDDCGVSAFTSDGSDIISGKLAWFTTDVIDNYLDPNDPTSGHAQINEMASTFSVWSEELLEIPDPAVDSGVGFAINECVIKKRLEFVLPRIIAFSTGMIDYFFRGDLEIMPPEQGSYAVKDHNVPAGQSITLDDEGKIQVDGSRFGYDKVRLNLRNTTPNIELPDHAPFNEGPTLISQDMFDGTLQAIVKYSLNYCYQQDGSGGFGPDALEHVDSAALNSDLISLATRSAPACSGSDYFSNGSVMDNDQLKLEIRRRGFEHIAKSAIKNIGLDASDDFIRINKNEPMLIAFDFSSDPIPLNATDVRLQVVYRGRLGPEDETGLPAGEPTMVEEGAVVVATKDISEPTDVVVANLEDYFLNMPASEWVSLTPDASADGRRPDPMTLTLDPTYLNPGNYKYYFYADRLGGFVPSGLNVDLTVPSPYALRMNDNSTDLASSVVSGEVELSLYPQDVDDDRVSFVLDGVTPIAPARSSPYTLTLGGEEFDTRSLSEGRHTIRTTLRSQGKKIWFDTAFTVHNNVDNTAPQIAPIADVVQPVVSNSISALDIPLVVSDGQAGVTDLEVRLSSDYQGVDVNRIMEIRQDQSNNWLIHIYDTAEYYQYPGNPPSLFYFRSHIPIRVTVSDGELESSQTFLFRRSMGDYSEQGYFEPYEISSTTTSSESISLVLNDVAGPNTVPHGSYVLGNNLDLPVYYSSMFAELPVDTASGEGLRTVADINQQLYDEWNAASGVYSNLGQNSLLKKLIDAPGWLSSMPVGVTPGHEFILPNDDQGYRFYSNEAEPGSSALVEIADLDRGEFVRFSFLSDLDAKFTLKGTTPFSDHICEGIVPEVHQWDEALKKYIQQGSARKVGNIFSSTRDFASLDCQLILPSVGNTGLVDSEIWTENLESVLSSQSFQQIPVESINSLYQ